MGLTFKENCPDLRNTRVVEIIDELNHCHANIDVYDPWADVEQAKHFFDITLEKQLKKEYYDAVLLTVSHQEFIAMGESGIKSLLNEKGIIFDIKGMLPSESVDERL
jgi:UDP-N-acetyl-D-galactosamine dehydrogenase